MSTDTPVKLTQQEWDGDKASVKSPETPVDQQLFRPLTVDPKVRRKVDLHLLPLVALLYLCSFL